MGAATDDTEPPAGSASLFQRIGGDAAVAQLVDDFYRRVLDDPELRPFFEDVPMDRLRTMQREFFAAALDGPGHYTGRPLAEAHFGRGIEPRHLRRFLDHLLEILEDRLDDDDVVRIISRVNRYVGEITGLGEFSG